MATKKDKPESKKKYQCPHCQDTNTEERGTHFKCHNCREWFPKDPLKVNSRADGTVVVTAVVPEGVYTKAKVAELLAIDLDRFRIKHVEYSIHHMARKDRKGWWKASVGDDGKGKVEGESHDSGKMLVVPLMNIKVVLEERVAELRAEDAVKEILKKLKRKSPAIPKVKYPSSVKRLNLLEMFIPDIHFGRSVWGEESAGVDYDMKIAEKVTMLAMDSILDRVQLSQVGRILFPLGNDFFNIDGAHMGTTKGTPQVNDPHWRRTFSNGVVLAVRMIEKLRKIAPVDVMMIEGNHDSYATYYLGTVLLNRFHGDKSVSIENTPKERKAYSWGRCAIGFAHGEGLKPPDLVDKFNHEHRELFHTAEYKEIHIGHFHTERIARILPARLRTLSEEHEHVMVRSVRALTPTDRWHFNKGFTGSDKGSEGFLWNKQAGIISILPAIIDSKKYR